MKVYISIIRSRSSMSSLTVETSAATIKGLMNCLHSKLFVDQKGYTKFFVYSNDPDDAYFVLRTILRNGGFVRHGKISDWLA